MVKKKLGEQAQILRVIFVLSAVDLEKRERTFAVNLIAGRMVEFAFLTMSFKTPHVLDVLETKFAYVNDSALGEFLWIR